jgi:leucyl aminopeptidase (aminopeptidase T)
MEKGERLEARIEAQLREWAVELESLKAKADKAVAEARKDYYEQVDELREAIEAKLRAWSKAVDASQAKAESGGTATRTLIERLHGRIQAELRELRPVMEDLRGRAQHECATRRCDCPLLFTEQTNAPPNHLSGMLRAGVADVNRRRRVW